MKCLILAAGLGSRLLPLTNDKPKCLVEVNGTAIIEKQINNLLLNGIMTNDIYIVTGYLSNVLKTRISVLYDEIHFIDNLDYNENNNMFSAFMAKEYLYGQPYLMMNADVFFDESVISSLLNFEAKSAIVTDVGKYNDESMKVIVKDDKIVKISKAITKDEAFGDSIDVYKFSSEASCSFFDKCEEYIVKNNDIKKWSEVALNDILPIQNFKVCPLNGRWFEIDTIEDLHNAEVLFKD